MSAHSTVDARVEGDVEAAFAQVLGAEQAARRAIELAHEQAARMAEAARAESRARSERTRRHISAVRAAFERQLQTELAQLAAQAQALLVDAPLTAADREGVTRAVARLAAELTTEVP